MNIARALEVFLYDNGHLRYRARRGPRRAGDIAGTLKGR